MRLTRQFLILCLIGFVNAVAAQSLPDKDYLLGKFNPQTDARFTKLKGVHASGEGVLRSEAYQAFIKMAYAAEKEKVNLIIISSTRNFASQKRIWENKWDGKTIVEGKNLTDVKDPVERAKIILHYSSMPGSSRHHWGTDMDLNSLENGYFATGEGLRIYKWLQRHAAEYGFCQPYTSQKDGRTGYQEEKWHWSYLPLSKIFLTEYLKVVEYKDITGFKGSETADSVGIIRNYVKGVACQ